MQALHATAAERGGRCLAEHYSNSQAKLEWECQLGHRWLASLNSIKQGSWCPECKAATRGADFRFGETKTIGLISAE